MPRLLRFPGPEPNSPAKLEDPARTMPTGTYERIERRSTRVDLPYHIGFTSENSGKMASGPDVLMVVDFFPPEPGNRSRRMLERARYLARQGMAVRILVPARPGIDDSNVLFPDGVSVERVRPWLPAMHPAMTYGDFKARLPAPLRPFSPLLGYQRWIPAVLARLRKSPPGSRTVLYTPSNPISLHLTGLASRRLFAGWIAELRDPIRNYSSSQRGAMGRLIDPWIERKVMSKADRIVLRRGLQVGAQELRERYPDAAQRIIEGPDYGIDLGEIEQRLNVTKRVRDNGDTTGVFAGNFYGGQTPDALARAVASARDTGLAINIELYGRLGFDRQFPEGIMYGGEISYSSLLDVYADADFAIIFLSDKDSAAADFVPSKFAELVALGKPLLAIGPPESDVSQLVRSRGLGVSAADREEDILAALREIPRFVRDCRYNSAYLETVKESLSNEPSEQLILSLVRALQETRQTPVASSNQACQRDNPTF